MENWGKLQAMWEGMHEIETENLNGSKEIYDFAACVGEKLNLEGREVVKNANEMLQKE